LRLRITKIEVGDSLSCPVRKHQVVHMKAPEDGLLIHGDDISLYLRGSEISQIAEMLKMESHQVSELEVWGSE